MNKFASQIILAVIVSASLGFWGTAAFSQPAEPPAQPSTEFNLKYTPPCIWESEEGSCTLTERSIASYIRRIYQFSVGIAGILAVGMIVVGAIIISVSAGSPDKQREGRDYITSALWGILLLFGSYLVLRTINPRLVALGEIEQTLGEVKKAPSYAAPRLESLQCPVRSNTGCFFSEEGEACDFEDESKVCIARDESTRTCRGEDRDRDGNPLPPSPRLPCVCQNCSLLDDDIPLKPEIGCKSSTLGKCMLEKEVERRMEQFVDGLRVVSGVSHLNVAATGGWRITEAFPPGSRHDSACHYQGTCFDFSRAYPPSQMCDEILTVVRLAAAKFNSVLIESFNPNDCPNINAGTVPRGVSLTTGRNSTGFHLHLQFPKD